MTPSTGTGRPRRASVARPSVERGLPLAKLGGMSRLALNSLKVFRITTTQQLLAAGAMAADREALSRSAKLAPHVLTTIVQRADMARVNGVGVVFRDMLWELGILDVALLAAQSPSILHERLKNLNDTERFARRSPTSEEVRDWILQAIDLPKLVTHGTPACDRELVAEVTLQPIRIALGNEPPTPRTGVKSKSICSPYGPRFAHFVRKYHAT